MSVYPHETLIFDDPLFKIKILLNNVTHGVAHFYSPPSFRPASSWHEQLEILIFREGSARVFCNEKNYIAKKNDVFVFNPLDCHSIYYYEGDSRFDCIMIDDSVYSNVEFEICGNESKQKSFKTNITFANLIENNDKLLYIFNKIIDEYKNKDFAYRISIKSLILNAITILLRDKETVVGNKGETHRFLDYYKVIYTAIAYIEKNYGAQITLSELSEMCGLEKTYFCRIFKKVMGDSCISYLNKYRLEKAAYLIKNTDMSISEISFDVGFLDVAYFSKRFKGFYGSSPNKYR